MDNIDYEKIFEQLYERAKVLKLESDRKIGPAESSEEVVRRLGYRDASKITIGAFEDTMFKSLLAIENHEYKKEYIKGVLDFQKTLNNIINFIMMEENK